MRTYTKNRENLGHNITQRLSRRFPAAYITETDFAVDIALLSDSIEDAQCLLSLVIKTAKEVRLSINWDKTEYMSYNTPSPRNDTILANEKPLKKVNDLKYLGSWVDNSEKDMKTRQAKARAAIRKLDNIWKSDLPRKLKINFFRSTVENILLYGAETWTMTKTMNIEIDGTYTRLLRHALYINWRQHVPNENLYGNLPNIFSVIQQRRLHLAGHCYRSDESVANLILWKPKHGYRRPGRPKIDYVTLLTQDTGLTYEEFRTAMSDREIWRSYVDSGAPRLIMMMMMIRTHANGPHEIRKPTGWIISRERRIIKTL